MNLYSSYDILYRLSKPLLWLYAEHLRKCCTNYFITYSFDNIMCRILKKVLHYLSEIYVTLLWSYADHHRSCCIFSFTMFHHLLEFISLCPDILWRALKRCLTIIWNVFPSNVIVMNSTKDDVSPYLWMYLPLLWM